MADPPLASTAVAVSDDQVERNKLAAKRRRKKFCEKLLSQKQEFKNAIQRPNSATIWISGVSTVRQVHRQRNCQSPASSKAFRAITPAKMSIAAVGTLYQSEKSPESY
jgi:hypothetical protein